MSNFLPDRAGSSPESMPRPETIHAIDRYLYGFVDVASTASVTSLIDNPRAFLDDQTGALHEVGRSDPDGEIKALAAFAAAIIRNERPAYDLTNIPERAFKNLTDAMNNPSVDNAGSDTCLVLGVSALSRPELLALPGGKDTLRGRFHKAIQTLLERDYGVRAERPDIAVVGGLGALAFRNDVRRRSIAKVANGVPDFVNDQYVRWFFRTADAPTGEGDRKYIHKLLDHTIDERKSDWEGLYEGCRGLLYGEGATARRPRLPGAAVALRGVGGIVPRVSAVLRPPGTLKGPLVSPNAPDRSGYGPKDANPLLSALAERAKDNPSPVGGRDTPEKSLAGYAADVLRGIVPLDYKRYGPEDRKVLDGKMDKLYKELVEIVGPNDKDGKIQGHLLVTAAELRYWLQTSPAREPQNTAKRLLRLDGLINGSVRRHYDLKGDTVLDPSTARLLSWTAAVDALRNGSFLRNPRVYQDVLNTMSRNLFHLWLRADTHAIPPEAYETCFAVSRYAKFGTFRMIPQYVGALAAHLRK